MSKRSKSRRAATKKTSKEISRHVEASAAPTAAAAAPVKHLRVEELGPRGKEDSLAAVAADSHAEALFFETDHTPQGHSVALTKEEAEAHLTKEELEERRRLHLQLAQARVRRSNFVRYVNVAVAMSLGVCVAAGFRHYLASSRPVASPSQTAAVEIAPAAPMPNLDGHPTAALAPEAPAEAKSPRPSEKVEPIAEAAKVLEAPAAVKTEPKAAESKSEAKEAPSGLSAAQERKAAQQALDRGNVRGAIAAGERSVELDATDGDAWLVLGAAYQMAGRAADARRAFGSCLKQGKHGAIGECRAMLQ